MVTSHQKSLPSNGNPCCYCGGCLVSDDVCSEQNEQSSSEWQLLFRQTVPTYQSKDAWRLHNENDPTNDNYSILSDIDDSFRGDDDKFHFKLVWPGSSLTQSQEWKQSSNPVTATSSGVSGYEAIDIHYTGNYWGGLEYNTGSPSLLDGSVNHSNWWYAVGSTQSHGGGIPGGNSTVVQVVELYVYSTSNDQPQTSSTGSGGTETSYADYNVHTFLSSGTFIVPNAITADFLIVAGGGGGATGQSGNWEGGGGGAEPLTLPSGETRSFIDDGDEIILRGYCERDGYRRIGFGECRARVLPARSLS